MASRKTGRHGRGKLVGWLCACLLRGGEGEDVWSRARGMAEMCGRVAETAPAPAKHDDRAGYLSVAFRPGARSLPRPCTAHAEATADCRLRLRSDAQPALRLGGSLSPVWLTRPHGALR